MITSVCKNCGKAVFLAENSDEQHDPRVTRYWSYEKDGSKRPFCDAACALEDFTKYKKDW